MAKRKRGRSRQCRRQPARAPPTSATSGNIELTPASAPVSAPVQSAGSVTLVKAFQLQALSQATAGEIAAESLRKERAQLHIDYLEQQIEVMKSPIQEAVLSRKAAREETEKYETILKFHSQTLEQLLTRAVNAEISTLVPCPTDSESVALLKRSITNVSGYVNIWEHQVRKSKYAASTAMSKDAKQLKEIQHKIQDLKKWL